MGIKIFMVTLILILHISLFSQDSSKEIKWMRHHFAPFSMTEGDDRYTGFSDVVIDLVRKELTDYSHSDLKSNFKRSFVELKLGNNVIHPIALKNSERAGYCYFTKPYIAVLPNALIIRGNDLELYKRFMDSNGAVDLDKLLKDREIVCGVSAGRAYGGPIDKALNLAKKGDAKNIYVDYKDVLNDLLTLLSKGRVDYTIAYPNEMGYFSTDNNFISLPIKGMPEYNMGHFALPQNEWGYKLQNRINPILSKLRNDPKIVELLDKWLDKEALKRQKIFREKAFKRY